MLFLNDRARTRQRFVDAWKKNKNGEQLEPLEKQIVTLLHEHSEYHSLLDEETITDRDFHGEAGLDNPFLHLSLHLALREQVGTDRPSGIAQITRSLLLKHGDGHAVEHLMIEQLAMSLWDAQRQGLAPDEAVYLENLKRLL